MVIDGKQIAERVYAALGEQPLSLGILIVGSDPVTDSFVRAKEKAASRLGVTVVRSVLPETAAQADIEQGVAELAARVHGIIVQLPLPSHIDTDAILAVIPPGKDVDGIAPGSLVRPPVALALEEILRLHDVDVRGMNAIVVGAGRLVGKPCAELLTDFGARVTVLERGDSLASLAEASVIVLGAGQPGMVKPEHIRQGVILIDAGTSESSGKVVGDADPACADKASVFTPVPGGVGPIAISMIFKNLSVLAEHQY